MSKRLEDMSMDELKREREKHAELIEEYQEEREMLLGQSGHHISSTGYSKKV